MDRAGKTGMLDAYRIEGLTRLTESAAVQQYMRTGALQFWVAGIVLNQWVRQLDYEALLKDLLSASVVGSFTGGWLQNLDFSLLPKDLVQYYQRAGTAYRNLEGTETIWGMIPAPIRMSGQDALREFHAGRDWSHIVPRSLGGGDSANEGIFELASLNRARGDATMTPAELDLARQALSMEALRHAVEQAARVAVVSGLVAAVVEGMFAIMEEGLLYFDGEDQQIGVLLTCLEATGCVGCPRRRHFRADRWPCDPLSLSHPGVGAAGTAVGDYQLHPAGREVLRSEQGVVADREP